VDVDLDHARVGRDAETREARIGRRLVAFEHDRDRELLGRGLDRGDDLEVVLERHRRRHEEVASRHAARRTSRCG
jgi:hypothetical protein